MLLKSGVYQAENDGRRSYIETNKIFSKNGLIQEDVDDKVLVSKIGCGLISNKGLVGRSTINDPAGFHYPKQDFDSFMEWSEILKYVDTIEQLTIGCTYDRDKVIKSNVWKKAYQISAQSFDFLRKSTSGGESIESISVVSGPCHNCGILLPLTSLQVDHYIPQDSNGHRAIIKMFRHLGLTEEGPTGTKSKHQFSAWGGLKIDPKGRTRGLLKSYLQSSSSSPGKWKLNSRGIILLSIMLHKGRLSINDLANAATNSFINFVPLCRACNGNKSNQMKSIK